MYLPISQCLPPVMLQGNLPSWHVFLSLLGKQRKIISCRSLTSFFLPLPWASGPVNRSLASSSNPFLPVCPCPMVLERLQWGGHTFYRSALNALWPHWLCKGMDFTGVAEMSVYDVNFRELRCNIKLFNWMFNLTNCEFKRKTKIIFFM